MFGNLPGWGIAGVLALIMVGFVWFIDRASVMTPPTAKGQEPAFIEPLTPPVSPGTLVTMDMPCAGDAIGKAIELYTASPSDYQKLLSARTAADLFSEAATAQLIQATHCRTTSIFASRPEAIVNYANAHPPLEALRTLGDILIRHALLSRQSPDVAKQYYEAAFSLGGKLFVERLTYAEMSLGIDLMSRSVAGMKQLATTQKDTERVRQLEAFESKLTSFVRDKVLPQWQIVSAIDQRIVERHAGDIFLLARESHERMWRVEALLKLGRYRYNAGRASDQRAAGRTVQRIAREATDPVIQQAAEAAQNLSIEQYRRLY